MTAVRITVLKGLNTMIKAIVFDMGGVLIDLDMERCRNAFIGQLGYEAIDSLLDASHQKGFYSDLEEGKISEDEFRRQILAGSRPGALPQDVDHAMWALLVGMEPYKADLLRKLSESYDLYLLSNNNGISMVRCREIFSTAGVPMDSIFRRLFLSYQMRMLKPSGEIFGKMISEVGLEPSEMLFIDDSQANADAAAAAGLNVLHYVQGTDLAAAVSRALGKNHGDSGRC